MPVLQIIFETIQSLAPSLFGAIPGPILFVLFNIISFFEVFFRIFVRVVLVPYIFWLAISIAILNAAYIAARRAFWILAEPIIGERVPKVNAAGRSMFEPATGIISVFTKTWMISDYCYDRFFLHAPLCVFNLMMGNPVEKYSYRERGLFDWSYRKQYDPLENIVNIYSAPVPPPENDYASSLRSFNLNTPSSSPLRAKVLRNSRTPVSPEDFLTENSAQLKSGSLIGMRRSHLENAVSHSPVLDTMKENNTDQEIPVASQEKVAPTIKIRFNRRKTSGGSFIRRSRRHRSKLVEEDSADNDSIHEDDYAAVKEAIIQAMKAPEGFDDGSFGPLFVRLAWHTSATYDQETRTGGSNGATMRFPPELTDDSNTGLHTAMLELETVKQKFPWISYGDLWVLAGATALEEMGCHAVKWRPGRVDCVDNSRVPPNGRLPLGYLGADHIRQVFMTRLGFDEREAVLLIGGGHTLGRCHTRYSGWEGKWTENPVHFSNRFFVVLLERQWEPVVVASTGREQYMTEGDHELMMLNTDMALLHEPAFKKWVEYYATNDNELFLTDFAQVFGKLIELGVPR